MKSEKLIVKREVLDILCKLFATLDEEEKCVNQEYTIIGEKTRQRKDWRTGELVTDEDGNPVMEDEWGYVPKKVLTDDDKAKLQAIGQIKAVLEKLI